MREASTDVDGGSGSFSGADVVVFLAFLLALPGVIGGLAMISNRHQSPCPAQASSGSGDVEFCYADPQMWMGIGLVSVTLLLAVLVLLAVGISRKLDRRS